VPGDVIAVRPDQIMIDFGGLTVTVPEHQDARALQVTQIPQIIRHTVRGRNRSRNVFMLRVQGKVSATETAVSIPLHTEVWSAGSLHDWPAAAQSPIGAAA